jgi:cysteinyl-tRNA synthetase
VKIYNTLTRRKEEFKPLRNKEINIYVCGPTVYDKSHIGHFKTFTVFDFLIRYLKEKGYTVRYVLNITDVDDKIIERAREKGLSIDEYTKPYIESFIQDMEALKIIPPDYMPKATEHITEIIEVINKLITKGYAYQGDGSVYYSVRKFEKYGKLSRIDIKEISAEPGEGKLDKADFALWKEHKPGEPYWEAPWGKGRPGWHIECSVMSMKYLGETIDIHGGGADLIFPHHENEIAQSEALTGKKFVRYWIHVGTLNLKMEKMSKSLGNIIWISEVLKKYEPDALRLYYFSLHYRKPNDFEWEQLDAASKNLRRIRNTYAMLIEKMEASRYNEDVAQIDKVKEFRSTFINALEDDFNTPRALASIQEFIRWLNNYLTQETDKKTLEAAKSLFELFFRITGIEPSKKTVEKEVEPFIRLLIEVRKRLREKREYELADYIRNELKDLGVILEDVGKETRYRIIE